ARTLTGPAGGQPGGGGRRPAPVVATKPAADGLITSNAPAPARAADTDARAGVRPQSLRRSGPQRSVSLRQRQEVQEVSRRERVTAGALRWSAGSSVRA